jgi:hypothetical protein
LIVGWIANASSVVYFAPWSAFADALSNLLKSDVAADEAGLDLEALGIWRIDLGDISVERYLNAIDLLVALPAPASGQLPDAIVAAALGAGKVVVLPSFLRRHYGPAPVYAEAARLRQAIERQVSLGQQAFKKKAEHLASIAEKTNSANPYRTLLARLARDKETLPRSAPESIGSSRTKKAPAALRILFVASDQCDERDLPYLLAVARRLPAQVDAVFAVPGAGSDLIEGFGIAAESLPSARCVRSSRQLLDRWQAAELERLVDSYAADFVVFGGENPSDLVVRALSRRGDRGLVSLKGTSTAPSDARRELLAHFDLVIEADEVAANTRGRRSWQSRPLLLFDVEELLPSTEAARFLCLDPEKVSVLIRVGTPGRADAGSLVAALIGQLEQFPAVQVVVMEGADSLAGPSQQKIKRFRGLAIGQYLNAFDFCIATPDYDAFHEHIAYRAPTIFVADKTAPTIQHQRAAFAQAAGAALHLEDGDSPECSEMLRVMMSPEARSYLAQRVREVAIGQWRGESRCTCRKSGSRYSPCRMTNPSSSSICGRACSACIWC